MLSASGVEIMNMSMGGVALRADHRLNIGGEYSLKLQLQDRSVQIKGIVVWSVLTGFRKGSSQENTPEYSAGLRFKDVMTSALSDLISFIDENKLVNEHRLTGMRFHVNIPGGKATLDFPQSFKVKLISQGGMLIETERDMDLEGTCPMEIWPSGENPIHFVGRVASHLEVLDETPPHYELGIEFVAINPEDAERLKSYVASLADS